MPNNKTVLVTGATGGQGDAVARSLLDNGWGVRALVRDPDKPGAKDIKALGAELVTGDLDDAQSLRTVGGAGGTSAPGINRTVVGAEIDHGPAVAA
ncbi:SDR family NAD(P)-dependent oxidoreductase [Streptomyces virginiae]|uniref:SDR family NAD(P)-dependent oxidoreductase n=1 Tax=Streptomyces virginiae TaxID=1961 RepID=UPI003F5416C8